MRNSKFTTLSVCLHHHVSLYVHADSWIVDDPGPADLGTGRANSFKDCAEKCANYKGAKKCVRFMWKADGSDRACYMRSTGLGLVPTKSSPFSSGQLL